MNLKAFGGTRLLSDTIIYGFSNIFQKSFIFFIIFLISNNLTVENYGVVDFILTIISLSTIIVIFGQDYAVARFFNQEVKQEKKKLVISQSLTIHFFQIIFFLPLILVIIYFLKKNNLIPGADINIIIFTVLTIFSLVIINFCQIILRYTFERSKLIFISLTQSFLFFLSIVYLINYSDLLIKKILLFYFLTNILILLFSIYSIKNWLVIPKKKLINNQLIKFGFSFGIISLLTSISIIFERFYVMEFVSTYYLGIYSLALKVGIIIQIIMQSILFGWEPYFLSNLKKKNLSLNLNLMLKITIFVSLTLAFFLNLIGDYIILFLGNESYIEAKYYILPIVIGIVFQELHRIPMSGILESKKVYWSTIVQLICLIILIFTLFFLKEVINLKIIVLLICFNYFLRFISLSLISNYLSKIKLNLIELTIILVIYLIILLIIYYFNIFNLNEFFKFITLILLSGSVLIYFLNLNEVKIIKKILINFFS